MELSPVQVVGLRWAKGPAKVEGGEIVLDRDRAESYEFLSPQASENMAFELAALPWHRWDEKEVVRFVRRYGLLSHSADDLERGENRESLEDWRREATALHFVGAFYQNLMESKASGSAKKIQGFLRQFGYGFRLLKPEDVDFDQAYMVEASIMLANLINAGLHGRRTKQRCVWGLNALGPGEFRLTQHPPDLVSRAYSAFAALIATRAETRFCVVCGKQFRPTSRQGPCCSTTCTNTARSRRYREKHSAQ